MKKITLFAILLTASLSAFAGDKDILRDGCSAIADAGKRSACFDIVEKMPVAPIQAIVQNSPIRINSRGESCSAIEFAEIDSMSKNDLIGLSCGYNKGWHENFNYKLKTFDNNGVSNKFSIIADACIVQWEKIDALLVRKFQTSPSNDDCKNVIGYK